MITICAWCERLIADDGVRGDDPGDYVTPPGGDLVSHGICPECAAAEFGLEDDDDLPDEPRHCLHCGAELAPDDQGQHCSADCERVDGREAQGGLEFHEELYGDTDA